MKRSLSSLAVAAALLLVTVALSAPEGRFDHTVREKFFAGFSGDRAALDEAMKICEEVLAGNPKHAEAMVWYGTGLFMRSGAAFQSGDVERGLQIMQESLAKMDEAVSIAPDNVGVRIPRGASLLAGSRYMPPEQAKPLLERALSDYERVLQLQASELDQLGEHPKGELLFGLAEGWSRADQTKAAAYFERIVREMPDSPYAKRARKWLDTKQLSLAERGCIGCHVSQ